MESAPISSALSTHPARGDGGALRLDLDADMDGGRDQERAIRDPDTPVGKVTDDLHPDFPLFVGQLGGKAMPGRPRVTIGERSAVRWRNVSDDPRFAPMWERLRAVTGGRGEVGTSSFEEALQWV